jgi:hypothetical protein
LKVVTEKAAECSHGKPASPSSDGERLVHKEFNSVDRI